jgi:hypothetical protein
VGTKIYDGKDSFMAEKNPRLRGLTSVEVIDEYEWFSVFVSQHCIDMLLCPEELALVQVEHLATYTNIVGRFYSKQHTINLIDFSFDRLITH